MYPTCLIVVPLHRHHWAFTIFISITSCTYIDSGLVDCYLILYTRHLHGTLAWLYTVTWYLVLMYPGLLYLLYPCPMHCWPVNSTVKPASGGFAAWCRDDEDVSHNRASVRWIPNGTKCHMEQSATPHTWWGPPLESIPLRAKCHMEQSATPHTWWGPPLESVGLSTDCATWC